METIIKYVIRSVIATSCAVTIVGGVVYAKKKLKD